MHYAGTLQPNMPNQRFSQFSQLLTHTGSSAKNVKIEKIVKSSHNVDTQEPAHAGVHHSAEQVTAAGKTCSKKFLVVVLLHVFIGYLGGSRFFLGYTGLGFAKLVTFLLALFGVCCVVWIVPVLLVCFTSPKNNERETMARGFCGLTAMILAGCLEVCLVWFH